MATATLTPRQQEIQKLLDSGKTPPEVAKQLKITDNAVYQQMRRMRKGGAKTTAKRSARKSSGRKSARKTAARKTTSRPQPTAAPQAERMAMTPLQAIRQRRTDIEHRLAATGDALKAAESALTKAREAHEAAQAKTADELKQLDTAERVLKGEAPKPARQRQRSANGKAETPKAETPAPEPTPSNEPAPEPAPEPQAAEPAPEPVPEPEPALVGEGPAQERPGVPTMAEFEQEPDSFGEDS